MQSTLFEPHHHNHFLMQSTHIIAYSITVSNWVNVNNFSPIITPIKYFVNDPSQSWQPELDVILHVLYVSGASPLRAPVTDQWVSTFKHGV